MTGVDPATLARGCLPSLERITLNVLPLRGGGNNRLYRVDAPGHLSVLKHYFRDPGRGRDRLGAEFAFLSRAWAGGLRCVPKPIGRNDEQSAALYGYLPGERLCPGDPSTDDVTRALIFLVSLNRAARVRIEGAPELGEAAEARFSVLSHVSLVDGRVARLLELEAEDPVDRAAAVFIRSELEPAWAAHRARILETLSLEKPAWAGELPPVERVLSPSDFGFHNALRQADGDLAFLDFEYAGWDDPAKLICDFFLQPAVPAPRESFTRFARGVASLVPGAEGVLARVALLWPLFQVKWCCILLNHFSREELARRVFASEDARDEKAGQLAKARKLLKIIRPKEA